MGATGPSHASLFTSRHPYTLGVVRNGLALPPEHTTLAQLLGDAGYHTAAFVSSFPLSSRFGFARGFAHYDDTFDEQRASLPRKRWAGQEVRGGFDRRAVDTTRALVEWLSAAPPTEPLFVWVHLFDPHEPFLAPPPYAGRFSRPAQEVRDRLTALYDEEILYADAHVERIVAALEGSRRPRELLDVLSRDHGEGLLDHGWLGHNRYIYEEEVRVPLVFRWRGRLPAGLRVAQPAQLMDVVPTLLSLLGLPGDGLPLDGADLSPFLTARAEAADPSRAVFLQRPYFPEGRPWVDRKERGWGFGLRAGRWKYFEAPEENRRELYDLERDPRERDNLADREPGRARELAGRLARWRAEQGSAPPRVTAPLPPDVRDGLEALGYLGETERDAAE